MTYGAVEFIFKPRRLIMAKMLGKNYRRWYGRDRYILANLLKTMGKDRAIGLMQKWSALGKGKKLAEQLGFPEDAFDGVGK